MYHRFVLPRYPFWRAGYLGRPSNEADGRCRTTGSGGRYTRRRLTVSSLLAAGGKRLSLAPLGTANRPRLPCTALLPLFPRQGVSALFFFSSGDRPFVRPEMIRLSEFERGGPACLRCARNAAAVWVAVVALRGGGGTKRPIVAPFVGRLKAPVARLPKSAGLSASYICAPVTASARRHRTNVSALTRRM